MMEKIMEKIGKTLIAGLALAFCAGCHGDDHNHGETITTVTLTFVDMTTTDSFVFEFDDPDGDGGDAPTVDAISLAPATYQLSVAFENRLEMPVEDVTVEVAAEAEEHQVFLTGSAINGPASNTPNAALEHNYEDADANGDPVGLDNTVIASAGSGELNVTLRHLPEVDGTPVKTSDLSEQVKSSGISAIGGESDVAVTFPVDVQ